MGDVASIGRLRVLCAGDAFITPGALADAARRHLGDGVDVVEHRSEWPDEPFGAVDGVREAAGDPAELAVLAAGADVLLTHLAPVTDAVLSAAGPGLRLVGSVRGGPVNIDVAAATRLGVPVAYLPGRNLSAVAEFVVGTMIALTRNVTSAARGMAAGRWDGSYYRFERCGPELSACTVGLVGLGAVGARVAELLGAFGSTVIAHDPYADPSDARERGVTLVDLPTLLGRSDIVSVHARLTDDTRRMFNASAFASMKPGAYFVNTARGELVHAPALRDALESGHLGGAALDVFDPEPPAPDDPLRTRLDVVGTPHLAGASRQVALGSADKVAAATAQYLRTGTLPHCANPEVLSAPPASG